jgi:transposase
MCWVREKFGKLFCRETIRCAMHRLGFSWKQGKKLLSKASPTARQAFVEKLQRLLVGATHDKHLLVYIDEAHIHQDADLGHIWSVRGSRAWVGSTSPGLSAKATFYGVYAYNEGQVHIWPSERANSDITVGMLERLRATYPEDKLVLVWDGAPYHRSRTTCEAATRLDITLVPLSSYSPDFMPVESLWRWLREDVTYNHCHQTRDELLQAVAAFERRVNEDCYNVADRLWVRDTIEPEEEKLRISK